MANKAKHNQAFERASKPALKRLRRSTLRMIELWERLDGRLAKSAVRRWENVLPHIPRMTGSLEGQSGKVDRIACAVPLLAVLGPMETEGVLRAIEGAILDGTFAGDAGDAHEGTRYQLVRLRHPNEQVDADLLRRVIGRVRYKDPRCGLAGSHVAQFIEAMEGLRPLQVAVFIEAIEGAAANVRAGKPFDAPLGADDDEDDEDDDGDGYDGWLEPAQPPGKG